MGNDPPLSYLTAASALGAVGGHGARWENLSRKAEVQRDTGPVEMNLEEYRFMNLRTPGEEEERAEAAVAVG